METMKTTQPMAVILTVSQPVTSHFASLFGKGVEVAIPPGCSIREVLCGQIGVEDDYLDNRIQTLFLDGKAVDDVDTAMINSGTSLALSAAMPGLVGATMRKGGRYAAMRKEISHDAACVETTQQGGTFTLKLFNLVFKELGALFLAYGLRIPGTDLFTLFRTVSEEFWHRCLSITVNGQETNQEQLVGNDRTEEMIELKILRA
jgi:hypothetical protein